MSDSILIVSFKLLGDIIVQTPAIKSIKKAYPNSKLSVLIDDRFSDVLVGNSYVDEIFTYPISKYKNSSFLKKIYLSISILLKLRKQVFTKVLLMDRTSFGCLIAFFSGAKERIGLKKQSLSFFLNKKLEYREGSMDYIDFYNLLASSLNITQQDRKTELFVDLKTLENTKKILLQFFPTKNQFISIHVGASREDKRWSFEQCALFIKKVLNSNSETGIIIMCGPKEKYLVDELFLHLDGSLKNALFNAGELYLKELVAFFSLSQCILCYDSASRHVAAALGKSTIVLMNEWNLANWKLYSESEGQFIITPQNEVENSYGIKNINYEIVYDKYLQISLHNTTAFHPN
ncbi:MAG: glycosyltransferase family 9 protein [Bdellovibrionota bacterium]